jgi:hypothetical protein
VDFLILKQTDAGHWEVAAIALNVDQAERVEAARQGYQGPGRYAAVQWDNREEFDMEPGPVQVRPAPAS